MVNSKEVTFHINNMAYTVNVDESIFKELTKYLDLNKNNDIKDLLVAYLRLSQEYHVFKKEIGRAHV